MRPGISLSYRQTGLSLVEIMVAMVISLILLAGVLQIYLSSKTTYRMQEGLSRLQENGRFAIDIISRDIRMAGFQGCTRLGSAPGQIQANMLVSTKPAALKYSANDALAGVDNAASGNTTGAALNTDIITVRSASPSNAVLSNNMTANNSNIVISSNPDNLKTNDILIITDCINADIFKASSVSNGGLPITLQHNNTANTTDSFSKAYRTNAMLMKFRAYTYYVADTGRTNSAGNAIFSLFRDDLNGNTEELVEGIENVQIQYALDTNNDLVVDSYVDAGGVTANQWSSIMAVRISILANTIENVATRPQSYTFQGTSTTPAAGDQMLRREFSTTISLRNRTI